MDKYRGQMPALDQLNLQPYQDSLDLQHGYLGRSRAAWISSTNQLSSDKLHIYNVYYSQVSEDLQWQCSAVERTTSNLWKEGGSLANLYILSLSSDKILRCVHLYFLLFVYFSFPFVKYNHSKLVFVSLPTLYSTRLSYLLVDQVVIHLNGVGVVRQIFLFG